MKYITILSLILLSCSTAKVKTEEKVESFNIVGTWEFTGNETFKSSELPKAPKDSIWSLLSFFGAQRLKESTGMTFEFTESSTINTNWVDQALMDRARFGYSFNPTDSVITFTAVLPKDSMKIYMPTKIDYTDSSMIWNIDGLIALHLMKLK